MLIGGLAAIQQPLALVQATGQALQGIADAIGSGNPLQVVNAIISAPAVMIDLLLSLGTGCVILTRGEDGVLIAREEEWWETRAL